MITDFNGTRVQQLADQIDRMKGPRPAGNIVVIDGRAIPHLTMVEQADSIDLILDGRFCIDVPKDRAQQVAWFVANALAIGQGYSHMGAETKGMPFARQVMMIETMVDGHE